MGSGDWFKTIISGKKVKADKSKTKGTGNSKEHSHKKNPKGGKVRRNNGALERPSEDVAATMIQTAFRAYLARKVVRRMKGVQRFKNMTETKPVKKQSMSTMAHLQLWSRLQAEIRDRRLSMVIEGRLKQKKLENQMKLEAKLHDLEVEWNNGSETMEEILARIHQREEAAVKRERSLAYAFSHQWRPNGAQNQGPDASELGKASWGWSWKERWIAARPWETRVQCQSMTTPKKSQNKLSKTTPTKTGSPKPKSVPAKSPSGLSNGKPATGKPRRLSFPAAEKQTKQDSNPEETQEGKKRLSLS